MLINRLAIYDRWGNEVFVNQAFMSNDKAEGWDGFSTNSGLEQGVYVYYLEYDTSSTRSQVDTGTLTVTR